MLIGQIYTHKMSRKRRNSAGLKSERKQLSFGNIEKAKSNGGYLTNNRTKYIHAKDLDKMVRRKKRAIERVVQRFSQQKNMIKVINQPKRFKPEIVDKMKRRLDEERSMLGLIEKRQRIAANLAKQNIAVEFKDMPVVKTGMYFFVSIKILF